jgi:hydrogenase maturation protease
MDGHPASASPADGPEWAPRRPGVTLVLGMGNPLLGDDGVGWHVADVVAARLAGDATVEVDRQSLGGLRLMERLVGYERAIVVDSMVTGTTVPGAVRAFFLDELPGAAGEHLGSPHDTSLAAALTLGRALGAPLPANPYVVAIEIERAVEVDDGLSTPVAAAVPAAVELVLAHVYASGISRRETPCMS